MAKRSVKLSKNFTDYDTHPEETADKKKCGILVVLTFDYLVTNSRYVCYTAKPTVSVVFTEDGVRKTVTGRRYHHAAD